MTKKKLIEDDTWREDTAVSFLEASDALRGLALAAAADGNGRLARDLMIGAAVALDKTNLLVGKVKSTKAPASKEEAERKLKVLREKAQRRSKLKNEDTA